MTKESYLVALDGSKEAFKASEVAWKLAKARGAKITGVTVIDTQIVWDVLGFNLPGLIGSGPYVAAFEALRTALKSISDALTMSFETRCGGQGVDTSTITPEGNAAECVVYESGRHNLLIMGRRASLGSRERSLIRTSLTEKVVGEIACPAMLISSEPRLWKLARLVVDSETFSTATVQDFLSYAKDLGLEPEIFWTDSQAYGSEIEKLKGIVPATVPIFFHDPQYGDQAWQEAIDVTSATLLFMTTAKRDGHRVMAHGPLMRDVVHGSSVVSMFVFPPSMQDVEFRNKAETASAATER